MGRVGSFRTIHDCVWLGEESPHTRVKSFSVLEWFTIALVLVQANSSRCWNTETGGDDFTCFDRLRLNAGDDGDRLIPREIARQSR